MHRTTRALLVFGGSNEHRRLGDLWLLRLETVDIHLEEFASNLRSSLERDNWDRAEAKRDEHCLHMIVRGTSNITWHESCLGSGDGDCTMEKVLERAWCLGAYQSI
ncbi:unnamed protein product, partial [Choristocarpus tenellus]